jgi:transcriptional regulator with XRE-family HTH domain
MEAIAQRQASGAGGGLVSATGRAGGGAVDLLGGRVEPGCPSRRLNESFSGRILAAQAGSEWDVVLIEEGPSKNGNFYPAEVLQAALPLFEGVKAYAFELRPGLFDHLPVGVKQAVPQGFPGNLVGWYTDVRIREVTGPHGRTQKAIVARFHISENAQWLRKLMRDAWENGQGNLLGFSIDAQGKTSPLLHEGKGLRRVDRIERVDSVDVVTHAAAGGRAVRLVASYAREGSMNKPKELLTLIVERFPKWCEGFDRLKETDEAEAETVLYTLIETNLQKCREVMGQAKDERLYEVARGHATLVEILKLLSEKKFTEAMDLLRKWMAVYPQAEMEGPKYGFYSYPYGKPGPDYPGPQGLRPYENAMTEARHRLGDFIGRTMKEKDVTAEQLARAGGITPATLMQIVRGEIERPPDERLRGFAKALGVSFERLLSLIPRELREEEEMGKDKGNGKEAEQKGTEPEGKDPSIEAKEAEKVQVAQATAELKESHARTEAKLQEAERTFQEKIASLDKEEQKLKDRQRELALREAQALVGRLLCESSLPEPSKKRLHRLFEGKIVAEEEVAKAIAEEREYLATLSESGKIRGLGRADLNVGADDREKMILALDGFFANEDLNLPDGTKVPRFTSFQEAYRRFTDDPWVDTRMILQESSGYVPIAQRGSKAYRYLRESGTTSTWAEVLGDSIRRKMIKEYEDPALNLWRQIVSEISNITDFRSNRRLRLGGYGVLETVGEQGTYPSLSTPQDEEVTFSIQKRGGIEDLTIEMVANDDVGAIRRIPINLGQAAINTLYRAVFDLLLDNAVVFDGNALASVAHANLSTNALTSDELDVARRSMRKQKAFGDDKKVLGSALVPKWMLVAPENERLAIQLSTSLTLVGATGNAATEPNIHRGIQPLVIDYWEDPNNWWAVADPRRVPTIEVGFWKGREEPELFVQDQPTVGSVFTADKISYKIRHVWGLAVLEYRGFFGGIVA